MNDYEGLDEKHKRIMAGLRRERILIYFISSLASIAASVWFAMTDNTVGSLIALAFLYVFVFKMHWKIK